MSTIRVIRNRTEVAQIKSDSSNDTYIMWKSALEKGAKIQLKFDTSNNYLKKSGDDLLIYSVFLLIKLLLRQLKNISNLIDCIMEEISY